MDLYYLKIVVGCDKIKAKEKELFMRNLVKKINFAIISMMVSVPAMAAVPANMNDALCKLAAQFGGIFSTLRLLAFVGAGFIIAQWAWGYISKPGDLKLDDVKTKGVGMLVGFIMLFAIGAILSAFLSMAGADGSLNCVTTMFK